MSEPKQMPTFVYSIFRDDPPKSPGCSPRVMIIAPADDYDPTQKRADALLSELRLRLVESGLQFTDDGDSAVGIFKGIQGAHYRKLHLRLDIKFQVAASSRRPPAGGLHAQMANR